MPSYGVHGYVIMKSERGAPSYGAGAHDYGVLVT